MDRAAWLATVCGVAKSWTQLKQLSMHAHSSQFWNLEVQDQDTSRLGVW